VRVHYALTIDGGRAWAGRDARVTLHETKEQAEAELLRYVIDCGGDRQLDDDDMIGDYMECNEERYCFGVICSPGSYLEGVEVVDPDAPWPDDGGYEECADCGSTGHDTGSNTCPGPRVEDFAGNR